MTTHLHKEIEGLKKRILFMGAEVEEAVRRAADSLVSSRSRSRRSASRYSHCTSPSPST